MKFKNKNNSHSIWIEETKTMIVWDSDNTANVTDKKTIKFLQEHGYMPVTEYTSVNSNHTSNVMNKK